MIKIFDAQEKDFSSNGNIVIDPLKCNEFKKKSLNGWYIECEIDIKYNKYIEKDKLCVLKTRSKANPQAFRIGDKIKRTKSKISFTAEHVMFDSKDYFLLDVRPTKVNGSGALEYINSRTDRESPFLTYSNVENISTEYFIRKSLFEAWSLMEERWGGIFDADNWTISFLNHIGVDNGESIIYGKNMEDMIIFEDWSEVCTKIYPVGYNELLLPEKCIESDVQYEKPYTKTITFESDLETAEVEQDELIKELRKKSIDYLNRNKYPKISYEVSSNINQTLEIGDIIQVKHPLVNIETEVLEYINDVILNRITSLTFGNYSRDVKVKFDSIKTSITEVKKAISKQGKMIEAQTTLIKTLNKEGYVYIDENEILILDKLPKEKAKNVWRFGLGGIGFSSEGYEGPFKTAITMDGKINANFITTGKLSVNIIEGLAETLEKWSKIMLNMEKIELLVHNTIDLEREVEGNDRILLENCMAGELQELHIYGNNEVFSGLCPGKIIPGEVMPHPQKSDIAVYSNITNQIVSETINKLGLAIYSDFNIKFVILKQDTEHQINYIKIEPNCNYIISLGTEILGDSESFAVGTYSSDFIDNLHDDTVKEMNANQYKGNVSYLEDFIFDKSMTNIHIKTNENDNFIVIRCNSNRLSNLTVKKYTKVDLEIKKELREHEDVCDEAVVNRGTVQVIRRIGIDDENNNFILENEVIENLDDISIPLLKGDNEIETINYAAKMKAKYIATNDFTNHFISEFDMDASLSLLADAVELKLKRTVNNENIIASLNMAILKLKGEDVTEEEVEKAIIQIFSNILEIDTENFKLEKDGTTTIIKGIIAGLTMTREGTTSKFFKKIGDYQSGLNIPDLDANAPFLFAGAPLSGNLFKSKFYVTHLGNVYMNGDSRTIFISFDSGRKAIAINRDGFDWFRDNENSDYIGSFKNVADAFRVMLGTMNSFIVFDNNTRDYMLIFYRYNPNSTDSLQKKGHVARFYSDIDVSGAGYDNVNYTVRIQGYEVLTTASDIRLKENMAECKEYASGIINKIPIFSFDWKKDLKTKDAGKHVRFGYGAQPTLEVFEDGVVYDKEYDSYQMHLLNLSALEMKGLQEAFYKISKLEKINKKHQNIIKKQQKEIDEQKKINDRQQKQIEFLINKLNCKEDLEKYLKEEKNSG